MKPITYKIVLSKDNVVEGVEIWQGTEHITVSLEAEGLHKNGYRWGEVRDFLDALQEEQKQKVTKNLYDLLAVYDKVARGDDSL